MPGNAREYYNTNYRLCSGDVINALIRRCEKVWQPQEQTAGFSIMERDNHEDVS